MTAALPSATTRRRSGTCTSQRRSIVRTPCVRSALISWSASCGAGSLGSVRGTRTSGTVGDFRRSAMTRDGQAAGHRIDLLRRIALGETRYACKPDTDERRRSIVRADSADSRSASRTTLRSAR